MAIAVHCLDSGPATAVVAAANIGGRELGFRDVLRLEIGGTDGEVHPDRGRRAAGATESEIGTPIGSHGRALRGGELCPAYAGDRRGRGRRGRR